MFSALGLRFDNDVVLIETGSGVERRDGNGRRLFGSLILTEIQTSDIGTQSKTAGELPY